METYCKQNNEKHESCGLIWISLPIMAKMGNDGDVQIVIVEKICVVLNCDISDIIEMAHSERGDFSGRDY